MNSRASAGAPHDDDAHPRMSRTRPTARPDLAAIDTAVGGNNVADNNASAIFAQLQHIQALQVRCDRIARSTVADAAAEDLQAEITAEHAALEGLNAGLGAEFGDQPAHSTAPAALGVTRDNKYSTTARDFAATSTSSPKQGSSEDAEKSGKDAYDDMAAAFVERQQGVDSLMDKVRDDTAWCLTGIA